MPSVLKMRTLDSHTFAIYCAPAVSDTVSSTQGTAQNKAVKSSHVHGLYIPGQINNNTHWKKTPLCEKVLSAMENHLEADPGNGSWEVFKKKK